MGYLISLESMCCEEMNLKSSPVNFAKAVEVVVAQIDKGGGWGAKRFGDSTINGQ